jgi:hypothetical protein
MAGAVPRAYSPALSCPKEIIETGIATNDARRIAFRCAAGGVDRDEDWELDKLCRRIFE